MHKDCIQHPPTCVEWLIQGLDLESLKELDAKRELKFV